MYLHINKILDIITTSLFQRETCYTASTNSVESHIMYLPIKMLLIHLSITDMNSTHNLCKQNQLSPHVKKLKISYDRAEGENKSSASTLLLNVYIPIQVIHFRL